MDWKTHIVKLGILTKLIYRLIITDKIWKQPKSPSTDEWIGYTVADSYN